MSVGALERVENRGKLFREGEEPAVGRRVLIAQSMDEATGCQARGGDASREPGLVDLGEEAGDLTPTGAFTGLAGIAHEHDVEVQTVAGGIDHAVGPAAGQVAEDGESWRRMAAGWASV